MIIFRICRFRRALAAKPLVINKYVLWGVANTFESK